MMSFDQAPTFKAFRGLAREAAAHHRFAPRSRPVARYIPNPFSSPEEAAAVSIQRVFLRSRLGVGNDVHMRLFAIECRLRAHQRRVRAANRLMRWAHRPGGPVCKSDMRLLGIDDHVPSNVAASPRSRMPDPADARHFEFSQIHSVSTLMILAMVRENKVDGRLLREILTDVAPETRRCIQRGEFPPRPLGQKHIR